MTSHEDFNDTNTNDIPTEAPIADPADTAQSTGTPGSDRDALTRAILDLSRGLMRHEHMARPHGGKRSGRMGQGRVLALLAAKAPMTQRELGYLLAIRPQSLGELLAKLEAKGLITRTRSEEDLRQQVVDLTDAGRAAVPDLDAEADQDDPFAVLTEEQRQALADSLSTVWKHLLETDGDPRDDRRGKGPHGPHGRGGHGRGRGGFGPGFDPREGFDPEGPEGPEGPRGREGRPTPDGRGGFFRARMGMEGRGRGRGHEGFDPRGGWDPRMA